MSIKCTHPGCPLLLIQSGDSPAIPTCWRHTRSVKAPDARDARAVADFWRRLTERRA